MVIAKGKPVHARRFKKRQAELEIDRARLQISNVRGNQRLPKTVLAQRLPGFLKPEKSRLEASKLARAFEKYQDSGREYLRSDRAYPAS